MISREDAHKRLDRLLEDLAEHFDSIQVVATNYEGSGPDAGTRSYQRGIGNFYARKAACEEFIKLDEAEDSARILSRVLEEDGTEL